MTEQEQIEEMKKPIKQGFEKADCRNPYTNEPYPYFDSQIDAIAESLYNANYGKIEEYLVEVERLKKRNRLSCEYESVDNDVVGIQDWDRTEYCLRIQKAVEYKGNGDHEDIPSILKDYENLILSRCSATTEREINAVKEFAEKVKEKALLHCKTINCYELKFIEETIDELLEEYDK